ncbi:MAG: hypothetical protein NVSMB2_21680 [Chloroflexota bacterium]
MPDVPTILIVDDEKPIREFLVTSFELQGYSVLEAWHGQQALDIVASTAHRLDLVITDVMMPVVGGVELCRTMKRNSATADIPIVLMSAAHPRASDGSGADAIIAKPFDLSALDAIVSRLLVGADPESVS